MSAGVSPISPVVAGTPASRTSYEATPVSPVVDKAANKSNAAPPSRYDPSMTTPRQPNDGLTGFSVYA